MNTRRKYNQEYKEQAIKLTQDGTKSVHQVALELGIAPNLLYRWLKEAAADPGIKAFPGSGHPRDEEMERLRKALQQAEMERDILKKAVRFFAQAPN